MYMNRLVCILYWKGGFAMMSAIELAQNIIVYAGMHDYQITNLKLQKMLYYVQGYFSAKFGKELFDEDLVNWAYGPVVPAVYYQYCSYGASAIKVESLSKLFDGLNNSQSSYVCRILDKCLGYTARDLVSMTHAEAPWKNTSRNQVIEKSKLQDFFQLNDPLKLNAE